MTFDFTTYLQSQAIGFSGPTTFEVKLLTGGFTNVTARVTFPSPIHLFSSPKEHAGAILKYAPPHLASDASHAVSITRQVIEARALDLITGQDILFDTQDPASPDAVFRTTVLRDALDNYPLIQVPSIIHHDTQNNVLWIEDLGELG
ncbi:hypothetical protein FA13DRAFT_1793115 [Coprinellus micaceus]|uniref:Aminoglycoside phosphotransferase domain-containing protein n=1 Tax=Coprinellus micaceus TaxID=71717 RepID=A0A4Y7T7A2_COPMI|nr:hypothetical protein FA13DRAFT_1793115 [Coprinellus micaceus]